MMPGTKITGMMRQGSIATLARILKSVGVAKEYATVRPSCQRSTGTSRVISVAVSDIKILWMDDFDAQAFERLMTVQVCTTLVVRDTLRHHAAVGHAHDAVGAVRQ